MAGKITSYARKWMAAAAAICLLSAAGVAATADPSQAREKSVQALSRIRLKTEVLSFVHRATPGIYTGLVKLNREVLLIDKELERLKEIESEFPDQKKIVETETMRWNKIRKALMTAFSSIEKTINTLYVTHLVNPEKGVAIIKKEKEELSRMIDKALASTTPQTKRLKKTKKKTWIQRIKAKLF